MYRGSLEVLDCTSFVNDIKENELEVSSDELDLSFLEHDALEELDKSVIRIRGLVEGLYSKYEGEGNEE